MPVFSLSAIILRKGVVIVVTLRQFQTDDMARMLEILTDNRVNKTYMLPDFTTKEDAIPLFDRLYGLSPEKDRYVRCIALNGACIGFLNDVEIKDGKIELGYVIHPEFQGKGYMTRALDLAIREVFDLGYDEILCGAFAENPASSRVMEKCGMLRLSYTEVIPYRGKDHTCVYYGIKKEKIVC